MTPINSLITLVRSLKGAPLACLFILILSHRGTAPWRLVPATGYSPNTITAALRLLLDLQLIEKTTAGRRLPPHLRSALLKQVDQQAEFANCNYFFLILQIRPLRRRRY